MKKNIINYIKNIKRDNKKWFLDNFICDNEINIIVNDIKELLILNGFNCMDNCKE